MNPKQPVVDIGRALLAAIGCALSMQAPAIGAASNCNSHVTPSTPVNRFTVNGAEAYDTYTGLTWARCPVGYTFLPDGVPLNPGYPACQAGSAATSFTWKEAFAAAKAAGQGWRVPNVKELFTLGEPECDQRSMNMMLVFPLIDDDVYWTSTPWVPGNQSSFISKLSEDVSFYARGAAFSTMPRNQKLPLRLVK